jgi:hypothetical protein
MKFKIGGERNSGTRFLTNLIANNFPEHFSPELQLSYWKHGVPPPKKFNERVVEIFVFRDLLSWLVSMYKTPYHLKEKETFENFLLEPQVPTEDFNASDNNMTIFDIRYYKYVHIIKHFNEYPDVIFVNLSYIQNDANCTIFLKKLNSAYNLNKRTPYITRFLHTKEYTKKKNRDHDINARDYLHIINKYANYDIERNIDKLTFFIKE